MKAEALLQKVKIQILIDSEFYSCLMLSMRTIITEDVETAATDGFDLYFNPKFLEKLTVDEGVGLMLHELQHVALLHNTRCGPRKHEKFNRAADYVINNDLDHKKYKLPAGGLVDHKFDGWATEKVYNNIPDEDKGGGGQSWGKGDILPTPKGKTAQEVAQHVNEIVIQAKTASEMNSPGEHIPESILRRIEKLLTPILPWELLLQKYMQEYAKDDYSWNRPNRRYLPQFYLPSKHNPTIKHLVVAFDLSGSITKEQQRKDLSEIESLRNTYDLERLTIYSVDTAIRTKVEVKPEDNILDIKLNGGGGTQFNTFFKEMEKEPPTILIFFSDLYVNFSWPKPDFDILWINTDNSNRAPKGHGETIATGDI